MNKLIGVVKVATRGIKHVAPVVWKVAKNYGIPVAVTLVSTHTNLKEKAELNELKKTVADLKKGNN